ncbi:hypothetical protein LTR84_009520 [Exophiala bonariae]|uniref:BTB domain-containing protein n=1 Tax=Exophiala bonariae TaxID=1690606 RepID=A0AAV9MUI7_9EURO|nr:hypothetical protein LTR84_009520 [Exophiala bonariae]
MDESNGFNGATFNLHIGPSKNSFLVHADIVSWHSKVLQRLIDGTFKESTESCAELPEVEPDTFRQFLAYAYARSSSTPENEVAEKPKATQKLSPSKIIELLLANGYGRFRCQKPSCVAINKLKSSLTFPLCDTCSQVNDCVWRSKSRCVVPQCLRPAEYCQSLLCGQCMLSLSLPLQQGEWWTWDGRLMPEAVEVIFFRVPERFEDFASYCFDVPLRVTEVLEARRDLFVPFPSSASLFDITRYAIFADIYDVEPLAQAAFMIFYQKLSDEPLDAESISTICELANTVYDNTPNSFTDGSLQEKHVLRRMLSEFVAVYSVSFTESKSFMKLLSQGGDFASDLFLAAAQCSRL